MFLIIPTNEQGRIRLVILCLSPICFLTQFNWSEFFRNSKSLFVSLTRLPYGPLRPPFLFPLKGENTAEMQFISIIFFKNVQMYVYM